MTEYQTEFTNVVFFAIECMFPPRAILLSIERKKLWARVEWNGELDLI